ncbi:MAG: hypothetical protein Q7R34_03880 [Dehalococcoidia bacterium]|nr:hypothetical protein [Dehalococcoidia bacterium]
MKRGFLIGFVLFLTLAVLTPVPALAAKPVLFSAVGTITSISDGTVKPAGDSGRWVVVERELGGSLVGDINGSFTMAYKANVELATQAGDLHGTLQVGGNILNVNGKIGVGVTPIGYPGLIINGHWNFTKGAEGEGDLTAWVIPITDEYGHVTFILASSFDLTGQWQP